MTTLHFSLKIPKMPRIGLSLRLLGMLVAALLLGQWIPVAFKAFLYAISLSLKEVLLFVLPVIIFSCLFSCLLGFQGGKALRFMISLFGIVCLSNFVSTWIAYGIGSLQLIDLNLSAPFDSTLQTTLVPLWHLELPKWLSNTQALSLGLGCGIFFSFMPHPRAHAFGNYANQWTTRFLNKYFIPVLPLFILGFVLKMQHEGLLEQMLASYVQLIIMISIACIVYLLFLFLLAARFDFKQCALYLRNVLPVALMGFSTMSSLATMPVTIDAAQKNTQDFNLPKAVIPATVNVHMVGVAIAIPMMAIAILSTFGYEIPSFSVYYQFALYFVLAQFAVAAVPGGGILVMLPLLESHLGFSGEMCGLITALYLLFDPAVTLTNVLGNSALVIIVSRLFNKATPTNKVLEQST